MDLILTHKVHRKIINGVRKILKGTVGSVGSANDHFGLFLGKLFVKLNLEGLLVFLFRGQVTLHGANKGPSAKSNMIQISLALLRRNSSVVIVSVRHTDEIASVVNVHSPVLSSFVPTLVGCVGSED